MLSCGNQLSEVFGGGTEYYHDTENKIKSILDQQYLHFAFYEYSTPFEKAAMLCTAPLSE